VGICAVDLYTVVNVKLANFLIGQYHNYEQIFEEAKARLPQELRGVSILRDLTAFVTPLALKAVNAQFKRLMCESTAIVPVRARLRGLWGYRVLTRYRSDGTIEQADMN